MWQHSEGLVTDLTNSPMKWLIGKKVATQMHRVEVDWGGKEGSLFLRKMLKEERVCGD